MELNIAVVDNLDMDCRRIEDCIERYFSERQSVTAHTVRYRCSEDFLKIYRRGVFQIVFLDICMGEISGLELAGRLRKGDQDINIVFMSSTKDYVFDSFSVKPDGYLCKPFEYAAAAEILDRVLAGFSLQERTITLRSGRNDIVIPINDIISMTACDHVSEVQLITGETQRSRTLFKTLELEFENEQNFLLCNRGVIINMDYAVKAIEGKIIMQNGKEYPIRLRDSRAITARFTKYTAQRMKRSFVL